MTIDLDQTLVSLFLDRVARSGTDVAVLHRPDDSFVRITWNELASDVRRTAAALSLLGVKPGDRVVQLSENRYEWIVVDLAIHLTRAIHVAIHASLTGPQVAYQIRDCGARLAIVSGPEQAAKLAGVENELPPGSRIVSHDPCDVTIGGAPIEQLSTFAAKSAPTAFAASLAPTTPDDLATILYTSGTTGEPKGVMLSHRNLASNALATLAAFPQQDADVRLCWLPLSHIYARTSDLYTWVAGHGTLVLARSRDTILVDCQTVHPTLINGVPYFYDKVCRHLCDIGKADQAGALQELLGGRMRCCCAGGAALPDHVARFFSDRGLPLVQGYGLTESSPVITAETPRTQRIGTVGPPIPGVEVRIADDGEILTRGPHVMVGYWNQPQSTAATIKDGWLHTGDIGVLDDGHLRITGRKKELIVTASGKNVAPTLLEGLLTQNPLISQAIVFGDAKNYLTALIVPNRDPLRSAILERQIPVASPAEAIVHPRVLELYRAAIDDALHDLSHCEQIGRFTLIGRGFTIESGELTPTLKLRREVIARNFSAEIATMYLEPDRSAADCGV